MHSTLFTYLAVSEAKQISSDSYLIRLIIPRELCMRCQALYYMILIVCPSDNIANPYDFFSFTHRYIMQFLGTKDYVY